jgi:hypothetical protein
MPGVQVQAYISDDEEGGGEIDSQNRHSSEMERRKIELQKSQKVRRKENKKNKAALKKMNGFQKLASSIGIVGSFKQSKLKRRMSVELWEQHLSPAAPAPASPAQGSSRTLLTSSTYHGSPSASRGKLPSTSTTISCSLHGALRKNLNTSLHGLGNSLHGLGNSLHGRAFKDMKGEVTELKTMVGAYTKENNQLRGDAQVLFEENEYLAKEMENLKEKHNALSARKDETKLQLQATAIVSKVDDTQQLLQKLLLTTAEFKQDDEDMKGLRALAEKLLKSE